MQNGVFTDFGTVPGAFFYKVAGHLDRFSTNFVRGVESHFCKGWLPFWGIAPRRPDDPPETESPAAGRSQGNTRTLSG